jgi:hypothetical protein
MKYTKEDVDKILEASKKATKGPWVCLPSGAIYKDGVLIAQAHTVTAHCGDSERMSNAELIAGAPVLADEVNRLRVEVERLHLDLVYQRREFMGDIIDRTL